MSSFVQNQKNSQTKNPQSNKRKHFIFNNTPRKLIAYLFQDQDNNSLALISSILNKFKENNWKLYYLKK